MGPNGRAEGLTWTRWGDPSGPTIVLLHGILGSSAYWQGVAELLPGHDVIALDLLGFGRSPRPARSAYDGAAHVDAVVAALDALDVRGPVMLAGHSMGALIALRLAAEQPERVRRLVLVGMPVFEDPVSARAAIASTTFRRLMLYGPVSRIFCAVWCRGLNPISRRVAPAYVRRVPRAVAQATVDHSWWSYSRSLANVVERQQVAADLRRRTCPTVVVYGEEDRDASPASSWGEIAGVVVRRLKGGHQLPLASPGDIAALIAADGAEVPVTLAAGAVICDADGHVLLVKRGQEPDRGRWSVPGGRVEPGETLELAAAREAHEETGLDVRVGRELWSARVPSGDGGVYEIHDFAAVATGGTLAAGDDADEVRWVHHAELDDLPTTAGLVELLRGAGLFDGRG